MQQLCYTTGFNDKSVFGYEHTTLAKKNQNIIKHHQKFIQAYIN